MGNPVGKLRIADLFCGCGGLTLGVVEACRQRHVEVEVSLAVDSDEDCLQVYRQNFGPACTRADCMRVERLFKGKLGAALSKNEQELASAIGTIHCLVAGPPCQGHSDLNNHSRRLDRRNALYARVARAAEVLKPSLVIIENVVGVTNDRGHVVSRVRKLLGSRGYAVESIRIDARALGVAQKRRRHFLVAFPKASLPLWEELPKHRAPSWTVGEMLAGLQNEPRSGKTTFRTASRSTERNQKRIEYLFEKNKYDLPDSKRPPCHKDKDHTYNAVYGRLRRNGVANTITSGFGSMGQGRFVHPTQRRMITPHEAARLQGFPDWFRFDDVASRGSLQTMIGNAVVPRVAASLVRHLLTTGILKPVPIACKSLAVRAARAGNGRRALTV